MVIFLKEKRTFCITSFTGHKARDCHSPGTDAHDCLITPIIHFLKLPSGAELSHDLRSHKKTAL